MAMYKTRKITFRETLEIGNWKIKVYTIAKDPDFDFSQVYSFVKAKVPQWLEIDNGFMNAHDNTGFLILHAGTEGVFSLINWWVGRNMLNTHIFLSEYQNMDAFTRVSGEGLAPCTWELEIVNHERVSWMKNVLKMDENPDYERYLADVFDMEL